jgi:ATP-binding protein involved in chromosome partitioning
VQVIELTAQERADIEHQLANRNKASAKTDRDATPFDTPPKRIIAVASGKGGVGKSTVTANLAVVAATRNLSVGVLDADLHGFSVPRMLGIKAQPELIQEDGKNRLIPPIGQGVTAISTGMFTNANDAVIWRGPVAHRAISQFLSDPIWGELDLLFVDLPPGTGDIALSIANLLPKAELLIVTTPQKASAEVAARAGTMAKHTKQKVIGVVENMSWLEDAAGHKSELFGSGGGAAVSRLLTEALGYNVPLLAQIPLDPLLPSMADNGIPVSSTSHDSPVKSAFEALADNLQIWKEQ